MYCVCEYKIIDRLDRNPDEQEALSVSVCLCHNSKLLTKNMCNERIMDARADSAVLGSCTEYSESYKM